MESSLVSVIVPVYNGELFLDRCINSVKSQTYENWEMLLVNDGSLDNSKKIIEKYTSDPRIKYFENKKNLGIAATRNRAIEYSKGSYLALLDQDDEWLPQKLEKQISLFEKLDNSYGLVYSNLSVKYSDGRELEAKKEIEPLRDVDQNFEKLVISNFIYSPTVMIKRDAIQKVGGFNESILWGGDDYELWLRIGRKYLFGYIDESLSIRHEHGKNYSQNKKKVMLETMRLIENYKDQFSISKELLRKHKSNKYYRYGLEAIKIKRYSEGLSFIAKSLLISTYGTRQFLKTILNKVSIKSP